MSELNSEVPSSIPPSGFSGFPADLSIDAPQQLACAAWPAIGLDGQAGVAVLVKAAMSPRANGMLRLVDQAPIIEPADRYYAEPRTSSVVAAGDMVPFKQASEVLIHGSAQPGGGRAAVAAGFSLYSQDKGVLLAKWIWALGERQVESNGEVGGPEPLGSAVPIRYENAYGGPRDAPLSRAYPFNPVGCGYRRKGGALEGEVLPQIVLPRLNHSLRCTPPGFGPVAASWAPRAGRFGKIDEVAYRYGEIRYQQPPHPAAYNVSPDDQRLSAALSGNESITLCGMLPELPCGESASWHLPGVVARLELARRGKWEAVGLILDTLAIDTETSTATLSWRGWLIAGQAFAANGMRVMLDYLPGELPAMIGKPRGEGAGRAGVAGIARAGQYSSQRGCQDAH